MRDFAALRACYDNEGSGWVLVSYRHSMVGKHETVRVVLEAEGLQTEWPRIYGAHHIDNCMLTQSGVTSEYDSNIGVTVLTVKFKVVEDQ